MVGSLCGTLAFSLFSLGYFSPALGMAGVMLIYLALASGAVRLASAAWFAAVLAAVLLAGERGAVWSPYYYITVLTKTEPRPPGEAWVNFSMNVRLATGKIAGSLRRKPGREHQNDAAKRPTCCPTNCALCRSGAGHRRRRRHRRGSGLAFRGPAR